MNRSFHPTFVSKSMHLAKCGQWRSLFVGIFGMMGLLSGLSAQSLAPHWPDSLRQWQAPPDLPASYHWLREQAELRLYQVETAALLLQDPAQAQAALPQAHLYLRAALSLADSSRRVPVLRQLIRCEWLLASGDSAVAQWRAQLPDPYASALQPGDSLLLDHTTRQRLLGQRWLDVETEGYRFGEGYGGGMALLPQTSTLSTDDLPALAERMHASADLMRWHGAELAAAMIELTLGATAMGEGDPPLALRCMHLSSHLYADRPAVRPHYLLTLAYLANLFDQLQQGDSADHYSQLAMRQLDQLTGQEHHLYRVGGACNLLALLLGNRGEVDLAQSILERGTTWCQRDAFGEVPLDAVIESIAPMRFTQAQLLANAYQFEQAQAVYQALDQLLQTQRAAAQAADLPRHLKQTYQMLDLGAQGFLAVGRATLLQNMQEHETARQAYQTGLEKLIFLQASPTYLNLLNNQAAMEGNARQHQRALDILARAEAWALKQGWEKPLVTIRLNQAFNLEKLQQYAAAQAKLQSSRAIARANGWTGREHSITYRLALLHYRAGKPTLAQQWLRDSVDWAVLAAQNISGAYEAYWLQGQLALQRGALREALRWFRAGIAYVERVLRDPTMQGAVNPVLNEMMRVHDGALQAHLGLGDPAAAFEVYESARSQVLTRYLARRDAQGRRELSPVLRDSLRQLQQAVSRLTLRTETGSVPPDRRDSLVARLRWQTLQLNALQRHVYQVSPRFERIQLPTAPTVEALQAQLAPEAALLSFAFAWDSAYAFVIRRDTCVVQRLGPVQPVIDAARAYRTYFERRAAGERYRPITRFHQAAYSLYQRLFAPLEARGLLPEQLIVVPDHELYRLPLQALVLDRLPAAGFAQFDYLLHHHRITYTPSATVWAYEQQHDTTVHTWSGQWFGLGDPIYNLADTAVSVVDTSDGYLGHRAQRDRQLGRLVHAAAELQRCAAQFPAGQTRLLMGQAATEPRLRQLSDSGALTRYRYLHLATHAWAEEAFPQLSGIVWSRASDSSYEGILHPHELLDLRLSPELLVLSACQTGSGRVVRGEGIVSLLQGLTYAGARRLILSLWAIDDAATARFFPGFYARRQRQPDEPLAQSLRHTQQQWLQQEPAHADPYFWASFVYYGQ